MVGVELPLEEAGAVEACWRASALALENWEGGGLVLGPVGGGRGESTSGEDAMVVAVYVGGPRY